MADMAWMVKASCQYRPDLPWTGPVRDDWARYPVPPESVTWMRAICEQCPALEACRSYATGSEVTAGFWAGRWRHRQTVLRVVRRAA